MQPIFDDYLFIMTQHQDTNYEYWKHMIFMSWVMTYYTTLLLKQLIVMLLNKKGATDILLVSRQICTQF